MPPTVPNNPKFMEGAAPPVKLIAKFAVSTVPGLEVGEKTIVTVQEAPPPSVPLLKDIPPEQVVAFIEKSEELVPLNAAPVNVIDELPGFEIVETSGADA